MELYDKKGKPIAYIENEEDIYTFTGKPVAYINDNKIFGFNGSHLGWFENGWIRDLNGECVLFSSTAQGGPIKPIEQISPIKSIQKIKPIKAIKEIPKIKSIFSSSWSNLSGEEFLSKGI